jgi:hypothetical protein
MPKDVFVLCNMGCAWLGQAKLWYNSYFHSSLGCSPFKALYGHEPDLGVSPSVPENDISLVAEFIGDREAHLSLLKNQLLKAQQRMKTTTDKDRSHVQFQVGDEVLLKLQPYAQSSLVNRPFPKLAMKYFGPFIVIEKIGQEAYELELPSNCQIHPTFHVSQLKGFVPNHTAVYTELPKQLHLGTTEITTEAILETRLVKKGNTTIPQVLIKWKHLSENYAIWENYHVAKARFPKASAWG